MQLEKNLDDNDEEECFYMDLSKNCLKLWKSKGTIMVAIGWGVLRFCQERKLGHKCMILNYFAPSLMYDENKFKC